MTIQNADKVRQWCLRTALARHQDDAKAIKLAQQMADFLLSGKSAGEVCVLDEADDEEDEDAGPPDPISLVPSASAVLDTAAPADPTVPPMAGTQVGAVLVGLRTVLRAGGQGLFSEVKRACKGLSPAAVTSSLRSLQARRLVTTEGASFLLTAAGLAAAYSLAAGAQ